MKPEPFDVLHVPSLHWEGNQMVLPDANGELRLVPIYYLKPNEDIAVAVNESGVAFRSLAYLDESRYWRKVGKLKRKWVID